MRADTNIEASIIHASASAHDPDVLDRIAGQLGPGPFALVMLFVSPEADLRRVARQAAGLPAQGGEPAQTGARVPVGE